MYFRILIKGKVGAIKKFFVDADSINIGDTVNVDGINYTIYNKGMFQGQLTLYVK